MTKQEQTKRIRAADKRLIAKIQDLIDKHETYNIEYDFARLFSALVNRTQGNVLMMVRQLESDILPSLAGVKNRNAKALYMAVDRIWGWYMMHSRRRERGRVTREKMLWWLETRTPVKIWVDLLD